jgi:hypothetical protein
VGTSNAFEERATPALCSFLRLTVEYGDGTPFVTIKANSITMKNTFRILVTACAMLVAVSCSNDELIEPVQAAEDLKTSATLWEDQFITMKITTTFDLDIEFYLSGNNGTVSVDWGDGSIQSFTLSSEHTSFYHQYAGTQDYTINISGDIKMVKTFDMSYEGVKFNQFHFGGMVNLEDLNFNLFQYGPSVINVSQNKALKSINMVGIQGMQDLVLASTNVITHLDLAGENSLPTSVVDRVIARIHDSVVNNPRAGFFNLSKSWVQSEDDYSLIGPPSGYSINKLRKLKDMYGWTISPVLQ